MPDREKVFDALRNCITEPKCKNCPWEECEKIGHKRVTVPVTLMLDALELLKEPEDKELTLADLDALVNMIAIKAKAEGRFFSPYEVELALVQHGQHDERFQWGETIKYSPSEVQKILDEQTKHTEVGSVWP